MGGDVFGRIFRVASFGESHGPALGCVVEGCPAGLALGPAEIEAALARRRPGAGGPSSPRPESDRPEILSGLFEGRTTGAPLAILIRNEGARPADYEAWRGLYRPGRGDFGWSAKYGVRDHRGGGRLSGRETAARVAAGAVAAAFLRQALPGLELWAATVKAAGIAAPEGSAGTEAGRAEIERNAMRAPDAEAARAMLERIEGLRASGDSAGGIVELRARGLPAGLGEPVFGGLDAALGAALLSIPGVKGVEFGAGFGAAELLGSEYLDPAEPATLPRAPGGQGIPGPAYLSNRAGGAAGGLSTGAELLARLAVKPSPTIGLPVPAVDEAGRPLTVRGSGRHDACLCPRLVPVAEAMALLSIADLLLLSRAARASG